VPVRALRLSPAWSAARTALARRAAATCCELSWCELAELLPPAEQPTIARAAVSSPIATRAAALRSRMRIEGGQQHPEQEGQLLPLGVV